MATLHSDTQSSQSSSFRQPSRLRKTASQHPGVAIFNLNSVLHDLWPTLVRIQPNGIRFDATQADPATLTEPTLFKASQEDLFDDLLNHTFLPRFPSPLHSPLPSPEFEASTFASEHHNHHSETSHPLAQSDVEDFGYFNMVKNRRSLQSILIPPFLQSSSSNESSPSPTRVRSLSAAASTLPAVPLSIPPSPALSPPISPPRNSPPSDLLDDDPFADLSSGPSVLSSSSSMSCANSTSRSSSALDALPSLSPSPRSPLSQHSFVETDDTSYPSFRTSSSSESPIDAPTVSLSSPPSLVSRSKSMGLPSRPRSSGHGQARPAHTRLAFKARPSLPSLHTLAQAQTVVPMVRRGRVGAQLPYEPWQSQSSAGADRAVHDEEISESVTCVPGLEMNEFVRRRPSLSRRPSGLSTIRDSSFLSGPLVASPVDFHASSETHSSYMDMDMDDHDVNDAFAAESSSRAEAWTHAELYADEDSTLLRADGPGLTRAHSEPYPSFRTLSGSQQLDPFCASPPDEATGTMPYDFPSPPHSSHIRRGSALINSSYSVLFPSHRYIDLTSPLDDFSIHHDLAQLEMSSHAALEAIGYPPSGQMGSGDAKHVAGDEFEPGTSAETIRTLNPSHRRTPSQQSQTLEWSPESSLLAGLPISPASTSSGSDRSSASGSQRAYDVESDHGVLEEDFLTFHSDSSEESLSPTLMSMSMSVSTTDSTVSSSTTRTPFSSSGNTPFNSIYEDQDAPFVLDEDVGCLAPPMPPLPKQLSRSSSTSSSDPGESKYVTAVEEAVDGGEGSGGGGRRSEHNGSYGGGSGNSRRGVGESSGGGGGDYSYGSSGGGHGGGRDGDDRRNRRPPVRTSFNAERDSEETSDSEDDYGFEEPSAKTRVAPPPRSAACEEQRSETDDDVPLARQIPTALKAQKTIRRQVRDENDMRRKKRAESKASSSVTVIPQVQPQPQAQQPRSRGYGSFNQESSALADAREALRATPSPNKPTTRTRTKTLPSNSVNPFSATDLRAKLMGISGFGSGKHSQQPSQELAPHPPMQFRAPPEPTANEGSRTLRPQRSFHRSRATESEHDPTAPPPVPLDANVKLGRSTTSVSRRGPPRQEMQPYPHEGHSSTLERARTSRSRRPSIEDEYQPTSSPRRPPLPPLPSAEVVTTFPSQQQQPLPPPKQTWQQRVFICGSQRYCQVEVDATTSIGDVLRILEKQGQLHGGPNLGPQAGWMVWEICHDFGMERPVRSFELLTSVSGSWVADKTTNTFMAKMTTLAPLLSRIAVPTSSPKFSGYVQHEYKRGKWQKRWLELREHSLWLSKKESGKDQVCLCSLHNFDAYTVTRVQKAPKGYVFAIKSTDNLSFFEDTSDYMHLFSCGEKEGANWLEKILLARSYVLYQDRNVLTNTNTASVGPTNNPGAALSRAGTRKRPTQPLLNIGPVQTHEVVAAPVFEPGSLLAKRAL